MKKLQSAEFHDSQGPNGPVEGCSFLLVKSMPNQSVRTKSSKGWPREVYHEVVARTQDKEGKEIEGKNILHFISYDSDNKSYLLESAVQIGMGYQRQEAKMTVDEIRKSLADSPDSMAKIVEVLSANLAHTDEGFPKKPVFDKPKPSNRQIEKDDVLAPCRQAVCLSEEHREIVRNFIASDPIEKKDLPDGVLALTDPQG